MTKGQNDKTKKRTIGQKDRRAKEKTAKWQKDIRTKGERDNKSLECFVAS